jgi:hypothetical protein
MSLPTPDTTQTLAYVLVRLRTLLASSRLTTELAAQQAALRTQSGHTALLLPAPGLVVIGMPDTVETAGQLAPGIAIWSSQPDEVVPDVAGDTLHVRSRVAVMTVLASDDTDARDEQQQYLAILAYAHAIGTVAMRDLRGASWGSLAGVYECRIVSLAATPAPVQVDDGWAYRYSMTELEIDWQTAQPAPLNP